MGAYYNELDPKAAAWLRELIADGLIAPGEVDERDVRDVRPDDLRSFQQVHLFAGIGGWSLALRRAGWEDSRLVWTASCPCQPFSAAGGRGGFADERHLWPAVYHLATQLRPPVLLGEQVASSDGLAWIDLVSSDMEAAAYSGGALDLCSAGFGAPNIRQRLYFVWLADAINDGWREHGHGVEGAPAAGEKGSRQRQRLRADPADDSATRGLEHATGDGRQQRRAKSGGRGIAGRCGPSGLAYAGGAGSSQFGRRRDEPARPSETGVAGRVADPDGGNTSAEGLQRGWEHGQRAQDTGDSGDVFSGAARGFWGGADWVLCRDDDGPAWRPVRPGSFPLAPSVPGRVALLRGAGNAINAEVAAGFIAEVREMIDAESLPA